MAALGFYASPSADGRDRKRGKLIPVTSPLAEKDKLRLPSIQTSLSLPDNMRVTYSAQRYPFEEFEDTTLYLVAPSCADLTAYASGPIVSLSRSWSKMKQDPLSVVEFASMCSLRISRSVGLVSSGLACQGPLGSIPSIPSIVSIKRDVRQSSFINSYNIIGLLGNGAYGQVVLASAKDNENGDLYAVKILRKAEETNPFQELFTLDLILEASSGVETNKGVVFLQRLREAFHDEERVHVLVLDYHPAELSDPEIASHFLLANDSRFGLPASVSLPVTFAHRLTSRRPQDETLQSVRLLVAEISLGLAFLHERGLVHQDIKPANILFSYSGHVVIGDFGATSKMPLSSSGFVGGRTARYGPIVLDADDVITFTPLYAAPELKERTLDGLVIYDHRSDWWSLGIVLYELVTGSLPFLNISGSGCTLSGRRSDGDRSLTFGELEALSGRLKDESNPSFTGLEIFLRSLLSHNPDDRLCWPDLKDHEFLYPLREMWEDIVELKHPPCPDPPTSSVYTDACPVLEGEQIVDFPSQEHSFYEDQGEEQKFSDSGLFNSSLSISLVKTWPPRLSDASSGDESIPDALPSSASIWIFDRAHDADFGVDDSGFSASSSEIAVLGGSKKHSAIAPALQSPFSSTPVLEHHHHLDSDLIKNSLSASERVEQPFVSGDLIAPEDLTWSLLEAMDKRDRLISERQRGRRIFREGRKMASGGFRRIFERLFTS